MQGPVATAFVADPAPLDHTTDTWYMTRQRVPQASYFYSITSPVNIEIIDPLELYTYAATATLQGAGKSLFARRFIDNDSPLDDG